MARILYEAVDSKGEGQRGAIEAESLDAAQAQLQAQGYRDIKFHSEPSVAALRPAQITGKQFNSADWVRFELNVRANPDNAKQFFLELLRLKRVLLAIDLLFLIAGVYLRDLRLCAIGVGLVAFNLGWPLWQRRHSQRYTAMLRAFAMGQWPEASRLLAQLAPQMKSNPLLRLDCAIRSAEIRVRQGLTDLEDEKGNLWPLRQDIQKKSPALFDMRFASVAQAACDYPEAIAAMRRALDVLPEDGARMVDVALLEARVGSLEAADEMLRRMADKAKPEAAKPFIAWARGLVALRRGEAASVDLLAEACDGFLAMLPNPSVLGALGLCGAAYAVALQGHGQAEQAQRILAQVTPVFNAHADKPLRAMVEAAFGVAVPASGS